MDYHFRDSFPFVLFRSLADSLIVLWDSVGHWQPANPCGTGIICHTTRQSVIIIVIIIIIIVVVVITVIIIIIIIAVIVTSVTHRSHLLLFVQSFLNWSVRAVRDSFRTKQGSGLLHCCSSQPISSWFRYHIFPPFCFVVEFVLWLTLTDLDTGELTVFFHHGTYSTWLLGCSLSYELTYVTWNSDQPPYPIIPTPCCLSDAAVGRRLSCVWPF